MRRLVVLLVLVSVQVVSGTGARLPDGTRPRVLPAPRLAPGQFPGPAAEPINPFLVSGRPIVPGTNNNNNDNNNNNNNLFPFQFPSQFRSQTPFLQQQQPQEQDNPTISGPGIPKGGPDPCPFSRDVLVHERAMGLEYHFSWCRQPGVKYSFQEAQNYCETLPSDGYPVGFRAVSIETRDKDAIINSIICRYRVPYIWTSARRVTRDAWRWGSGIASQYDNWSHTGSSGRRQPDDQDNMEDCLAVLNNFYHDGIRWHDIGCELGKFTICERPDLR